MKKLLTFQGKAVGAFWLISVGLHTIALMTPISSLDPLPKNTVVKVTKLQKFRSSEPFSIRPTSKPALKPSPVKPKPRVRQNSALPQVAASPGEPVRPTPVASPSPTPTPFPVASPTPSPVPSPTSETGAAIAAFSKTAGASPACNQQTETCWQVKETQWRSVARDLTKRLEDEGFDVTKLDDLEIDTGMGIYQVSKSGVPKYYLHLLLTDQGTSYLLKEKPLSQGELKRAIGV
ncbi:MAG: hypothetical protein WCA35_17200 [Kovacikia sp.]